VLYAGAKGVPSHTQHIRTARHKHIHTAVFPYVLVYDQHCGLQRLVRSSSLMTPRVPQVCRTCLYRCISFGPIGEKRMHALKGLAYRKLVAAASSPAATCKQGAALKSPARHACGDVRPSRARMSMLLSFSFRLCLNVVWSLV
jgi:hypothetical protein